MNTLSKSNFGFIGKLFLTVFTAFVLLVFFAPEKHHTLGFENIDEIMSDAAGKDEFVKPDKFEDYTWPLWHGYWPKIHKGFFGRRLDNAFETLGIKKRPAWSASYFRYLFEKVTRERKEEGYRLEHVVRLVPSDNARFIIFGDLHGSYHSLVRSLQRLVELGVINKDLTLARPDDHIVFMGDAINRSAFVMETLTIMAKLADKNHDRVWHLGGNAEHTSSYEQYIIDPIGSLPFLPWEKRGERLTNVVEKYLWTLPLGIYLSVPPHNTDAFVRISHFERYNFTHIKYKRFVDLLNPDYYSDALLEGREADKRKVIYLDERTQSRSKKLIDIKGLINSVTKMWVYDKKSRGLQRLISDGNAATWTAMSCPSAQLHTTLLDFHYDAFVVLQVASRFDDWTITRHSRDIKSDEKFQTTTYDFMWGRELIK
ncbi:metallophosphoesterase [Candidatus Babeliales bacterium]|nr:metallophosphoesterase [Candidatus Babeliales bacterium]